MHVTTAGLLTTRAGPFTSAFQLFRQPTCGERQQQAFFQTDGSASQTGSQGYEACHYYEEKPKIQASPIRNQPTKATAS